MSHEFGFPSHEKIAENCAHGGSEDDCEICLEERIKKTHPAEKYDITIARNIEGGNLENYQADERLSEKEAVIYQDYAAKKDGIKFSEQASNEAYEEAQKMIDDLRKNESDKE